MYSFLSFPGDSLIEAVPLVDKEKCKVLGANPGVNPSICPTLRRSTCLKGTFSIHTFAPTYDGSDRESSCNVRAYRIPRTGDRVQHTCELWFKMDVQTI